MCQVKYIRNALLLGFVVLFAALVIVLIRKGTRVTVITVPDGANVYLEDKPVGRTPVIVTIPSSAKKLRVQFQESGSRSKPILPEDKKTSRTLTAAYLPLAANLPLFVALEKGFFTQNGINVKAIEATSPNHIITGIVSGQVDFAAVLAYSLLFPAANRYPDKFKLFSSSEETFQYFTSSIITKKDSVISSYKDLKGKKIGVYTGLVQINFLKAMLVGMGIGLSDVEIVQISPRLQIQGLVSGEYDALSSTEPTVNIAKLQGIAKVVVENPRVKYIMNPFPSTAATISTKLLIEEPQVAKAIIDSLNMAIDFINIYPEEAKKTLPKYTPIPKEIEDEVLADLKLFKYCKLGEENRLNVQRFADFLFENEIMRKQIDDVNKLFGDYKTLNKE